ncbi:hypothetical protein DFR27_0588 [Umboniibacter marinipuniceus]|uniref:DUF1254 domain-containing protein n=2 Tax=Umboniibacter marinipuniceus TaxID=569599 RepID=A0A3M0ADQ5_9GAMM|nr:hypothetical protein DFR27_0588 [Umboniibacter marinipuniceus]
MRIFRNILYILVVLLPLSVLTACSPPAKTLSAQEAQQIAEEAYIFGYPLVTMEMTRRVMTNVPEPDGARAPMGHLLKYRSYPTAEFRDVTAPNADTLYTSAWVDVTNEPWILSLPDSDNRYALFPMLSGWTDVFQVPGKRTTGTGPQKYAITGPGWAGELPDGVTEYKSPTSIVWLLGRIYCDGTPEDYAKVHRMQDDISLTPLSYYDQPFTPAAGNVDTSVDMNTAVRDQVHDLDIASYFNLLATLMVNNPASAADAPIIEKMAELGIEAGKPFDVTQFDADVQAAMEGVPKSAVAKIMGHFSSAGENINGWLFTTQTGIYETDYLQRALITAIGLGANRPQDAIYPTLERDTEGNHYSGENNYVMHFPKGQVPPVEGFWSLTMYNEDYFFVDNPLNRYTISSRNDYKLNADGSLDLYLQHSNPGPEKESNWLPSPSGRFTLMLRLYWPSEESPSILDGTWEIPAVQKVSE